MELCLRHWMTDLLLLFPGRRFKKRRIQMIADTLAVVMRLGTPGLAFKFEKSERAAHPDLIETRIVVPGKTRMNEIWDYFAS